MKKLLVFLVLFCVAICSSAYAKDNYVDCSVVKAKQGFTNIVTGWLEVPYQIVKGYRAGLGDKNQNKILGGFFGIFRGVVHGVGRTAAGAYELVTFPLPNPKTNEGVGIPLDSKNVWEDGTQYSIMKNGIRPVGKKIKRGLINSVFGVIDMPAQLGKGFSEDKPVKGLAKAVIFPIGRIASGVYDVVTFILPNDMEGYGYPLSEKYPWDALQKKKYDNGL